MLLVHSNDCNEWNTLAVELLEHLPELLDAELWGEHAACESKQDYVVCLRAGRRYRVWLRCAASRGTARRYSVAFAKLNMCDAVAHLVGSLLDLFDVCVCVCVNVFRRSMWCFRRWLSPGFRDLDIKSVEMKIYILRTVYNLFDEKYKEFLLMNLYEYRLCTQDYWIILNIAQGQQTANNF